MSVFAQPRRRLARFGPPGLPPLAVSLDEAILHLRLDPAVTQGGPETALIEGYIRAATRAVEEYASIAVMEQDWRMTLAHWPWAWTEGLDLPYPPFAELLRIRVNFIEQPLGDFYVEVADHFPSVLYPAGRMWAQPAPLEREGIIVEYRAGHAASEAVPATIKQAILLAIGSFYENRESLQQFTLTPMVEIGWQSLLTPYRAEGLSA